ncbi:protein of unknown function [Acidithiobacillus ferrivorans]|uniref:Uncharacterized protein n=1 Tax=Acidithiobacillus ferrivorans TaxID=160808 RepID=A0ABY1MMG0_9PROT|nr:protein of unknown function [Acidithiobacillus ferrivorans]
MERTKVVHFHPSQMAAIIPNGTNSSTVTPPGKGLAFSKDQRFPRK